MRITSSDVLHCAVVFDSSALRTRTAPFSNQHITRYLLFFGKAKTAFCTCSMGSHDTLRTLPKSPRRLRILAKACSSRKSHIHCAAPRGVRVDQRLAGEITCGTSKNTRFYKVFDVIAYHIKTSRFISFLSILPICCNLFAKA